jgi:predicted phosphate transport protein (TIGR00153 family)
VWRSKNEAVIRDLIIQHGQAVLETVKALHQYVTMVREKKPSERQVDQEERLAKRVLELESQADLVEEEVNLQLFRGAFLPVTTSDRYDLVATIDGIADRCELIVRKLRILGEPIALDVKAKLGEMTDYCVEATAALLESVQLMSKDFDAALTEARKVKPIREHNREVEFATLELLVKHDMHCSSLILLHDIVQLLGKTGDRAKRAADAIVSMIIRYRA